MAQSPIELYEADALTLADPGNLFKIHYQAGASFPGQFEWEKGHWNFVFAKSTAANFPEVTFRGVNYRLAKIHLHEKSEHVVEKDVKCDYEIHLIHAAADSSAPSPLVVIGILYTISKDPEKSRIQSLCQCVGEKDGKERPEVNPLDFFPLQGAQPDLTNWFHYEGSLTGYPYTENVSWFVMKNPGHVTESEIKDLHKNASQHAREVQPLDRRLVVRSF
jgi:carbonic anhydrase